MRSFPEEERFSQGNRIVSFERVLGCFGRAQKKLKPIAPPAFMPVLNEEIDQEAAPAPVRIFRVPFPELCTVPSRTVET